MLRRRLSRDTDLRITGSKWSLLLIYRGYSEEWLADHGSSWGGREKELQNKAAGAIGQAKETAVQAGEKIKSAAKDITK
jgi:hypothetical protein